MKRNLLSTLAMISVLGLHPASSNAALGADTVIEEIPVQVLLAPPVGYDDNDNVQIVIHGSLPNSCYTIGENRVEPTGSGHDLKVHQYAIRNTDGICAENEKLPPHMKMTVPFTTEASAGILSKGDYALQYTLPNGQIAERKLNVSRAITPSVDNVPYAAVSSVLVSDAAAAGETVTATLSGVLNSTCTSLDPLVRVQKENDVFVVLPTIRVKQGVLCAQVLVPFETKVSLGQVTQGHYLVHVRSMNGHSVNHVIEVTPQ